MVCKNIYTFFCKKLSKGLFSHQKMLLTYQRVFLSLKSSLLQKHMLQLLDCQESNVQLMKRLILRMQPDQKNLAQFAILLVFQSSLLTKVWNYNEEVFNSFECLAYFKVTVFYYILLSVFYLFFMAEKCSVCLKKTHTFMLFHTKTCCYEAI